MAGAHASGSVVWLITSFHQECAERAGQATDDGYRTDLHHDIENPP
jgi:hypothetical protein